MKFRQPLTRAELLDIGVRKDPDDIKHSVGDKKAARLGASIDQLQRSLSVGGGPGMLPQALRSDLVGEPCIDEQPKLELEKA